MSEYRRWVPLAVVTLIATTALVAAGMAWALISGDAPAIAEPARVVLTHALGAALLAGLAIQLMLAARYLPIPASRVTSVHRTVAYGFVGVALAHAGLGVSRLLDVALTPAAGWVIGLGLVVVLTLAELLVLGVRAAARVDRKGHVMLACAFTLVVLVHAGLGLARSLGT